MPEQPVDFSGVRLKQARAESLIAVLQAEVERFLSRNPFSFRHTTEPGDGGATVHRVLAVVREEPPVEWAPIIGDAVHNLRSALDHAVWAMADPAERIDRAAQFPIYASEANYEENAPRLLAGVSPRRQELIRSEQPFHWPDPNRAWHPLGLLQWLDNDDKHRTLHTLAVVSDFQWILTDNTDPTITYLAQVGDTLTHDAQVMRYETVPVDPAHRVVASPQIDLGVSIEGTRGVAMLDRLRDLARHVEHHVIRPLENPDAYHFLPLDPTA